MPKLGLRLPPRKQTGGIVHLAIVSSLNLMKFGDWVWQLDYTKYTYVGGGESL